MNHQRLLRLAAFLDELDPALFTMMTWVRHTGTIKSALVSCLPPRSCACPIGWMPMVEPESWCWVGVRDEDKEDKFTAIYPVCKEATMWSDPATLQARCTKLDPVVSWTWHQVREWFELDNLRDTALLFEPSSYGVNVEPQPERVAARIRHMLQ